MEEEVSMQIQVAGRSYPLLVTTSESLNVQEIEKEINEKVNELKSKYKDLDTQDCLALSLISQKMDSLQPHLIENQQIIEDSLNELESILQAY